MDNYRKITLSTVRRDPEPGEVVIRQFESDWNDFGYQIKCTYKFQDGKLLIEGDLFFGFLEVGRSGKADRSLYSWLEREGLDSVSLKEAPSFFTMLPSMQDYRYVVEALGPGGARSFLSSINDLVVNKSTQGAQKWIDDVCATEVFRLAFMRGSSCFFAFHNAGSVLKGLDEEDVSAISSFLKASFLIDPFNNPHAFTLKYDANSLIPKRINVMIGRNGLGKSQCLRAFCVSLLKGDGSVLDHNGGRPMVNRVISISTPGEAARTFPDERLKGHRSYYKKLNISGKKISSTQTIVDGILQLARSGESIKGEDKWNMFQSSLSGILPFDSIFIKSRNKNHPYIESYIPLDRVAAPYMGEQARLELLASLIRLAEPKRKVNGGYVPLSSGELTFFKFSLAFFLYIDNGSFVLIDEPETHLHPNLISTFVGLLHEVLERTGSYGLIATHSPYFVREVPRDQVHVLKSSEPGFIQITNSRLKTFGSDIDSISQFVFDEDVENELMQKIVLNRKGRGFEEIACELESELSLSALMTLKRMVEEDSEKD